MTDDYDEYLNADENDFETDDFSDDEPSSGFGEGILEADAKPKKKAVKKKPAKSTKPAKAAPRTRKKEVVEEVIEDEVPIVDEVEDSDPSDLEDDAEEAVVPKLPTDYVVHVYRFGKWVRTIDRPFTAEDAEAFSSDFNRTAKSYGNFALAGKESAKPPKTVPWRSGISPQGQI